MKNLKIILIFILTAFLSITCTVVAQNIIQSKEVSYSNKGSIENVQTSLDELYKRAGYTEEEYHEDILHGAYPVLSDELLPVYIKENGDVYYANTHMPWYSYREKMWANAVILVDDAYSKNKYSVGDKISEEDIESYFVWIPRYAYKLWDLAKSYTSAIDAKTLTEDSYANGVANILGGARIIDVTFGNVEYLSGDDYKKLIRNADGTFSDPEGIKVDDWLVHPGFTLGDNELNGFWMGKFETGYNQTNSGESAITGIDKWNTQGAQVDSSTSNKIIVKPNVTSWRSIKVSNIFNAAKGYNENLKSHMLKNTEWGAVAYLSHSKYGKGAEININNASDYKTGFSALNSNEKTVSGQAAPSTNLLNEAYNTGAGYLASTTGNITGVYDMSGGVWEYVASRMISSVTRDESGFEPEEVTSQMKAGYIDAYPSDSSIANYSKRILGDATGELGPFHLYYDGDGTRKTHNSVYADASNFISAEAPWFYRGGGFYSGVITGTFGFDRNNGVLNVNSGFRLALAP